MAEENRPVHVRKTTQTDTQLAVGLAAVKVPF
jgi:hypothetical protein